MIACQGMAVKTAKSNFSLMEFNRRDVGPSDVLIEIAYCGVCHSDLHKVREEWGPSLFPLVPGHEIVGVVKQVGANVSKFQVGDHAGVGCFVDSCRTCASCQADLEQYCEEGFTATYNNYEKDGKTLTFGGYSSHIVVDEKYTLNIPKKLDLARVAPLLCAGITTYSPLKHWKIGKNHRLGVVGLGGLGHMAVKLGASLGAEVTMLSTSPSKEADARRLGAHHFSLTTDPASQAKLANHFDFIINTVSAKTDLSQYMDFLKTDGTMILLGVPPTPHVIPAFSLIWKRKKLAGSLIGGIKETQEMLDYCAEHDILADIELISAQEIEPAYERMLKGEVKYRFVIDLKTLKKAS